jgi:hypothetical protein
VVHEPHLRPAERHPLGVGRGRFGGTALEDGTGDGLVARLEERDGLAQGVDDLWASHSGISSRVTV